MKVEFEVYELVQNDDVQMAQMQVGVCEKELEIMQTRLERAKAHLDYLLQSEAAMEADMAHGFPS